MRGIALLLIFASSTVFAQVGNHKLGEVEAGAKTAGVAVAVSTRNNKNMVVYAAGKLLYSNDAGVTWTPSRSGVSDILNPSIAVDSKGSFIIVYGTSAFSGIFSSFSSDDGKSWSEPVQISTSTRSDYNPHIAAHPKRESLIVTWTQSDKYHSAGDSCKSDIMMSTSGNGGRKWSKPLQMNQNSGTCADEDYTLRGAYPSVALDGKTFVLWGSQGAMFYDRSFDGEMWLSTDLAVAEQLGGWNIDIPGFGPVANTPVVAVDNSPSRIKGTLFMVYSDIKSGDHDTDIWLMRSVNRGDNWTEAARINKDEPGKEQFLPRISIDAANGSVYILYYDRRNYDDNQTDVYLSWSVDGGNQFNEKKINDKPITPAPGESGVLVDYLGLSVSKGLIIPVWTAFDGTKQEVWTSVLKEFELNK
jgi:hypothetical protein